ncbi:hypothetical protein BB559_000033 [Furculomyces boomerangus]|uniref:Hsp90 chaperone protein kinase-targeting subunit n=2 Tax=Harpellales TaxID=61421 RepID=A0A2T9Z6H6_9FUNG|nr:hypothetical protein BB559_000033 [Furculomyces boomerangus]PWA01378.1 hypothetical protein BB558_002531 [Smittium angustum]
MPIDYSKWNNLELSDDSDVEVHPNIERGTFIRLRQQKIRQDRENRKQELVALESEIPMNKELIAQIEKMKLEIQDESEDAFKARLTGWAQDFSSRAKTVKEIQDAIREGTQMKELTMEEMIDGLIYRVQEELLAKSKIVGNPETLRTNVIEILSNHIQKLLDREPVAQTRIEEIKKEMRLHLSVDDVSHEGFTKTIITKDNKDKKTIKTKTKTVELLNPGYEKNESKESEQVTEVVEEINENDDEENLELSKESKEFAMIKTMNKTTEYIKNNPNIISSKNSDQILAHAFELQLEDKPELAKQFVRQSLVITYIMQMGTNGVNVFFNKISKDGSPGSIMFYSDVDKRYNHIVERCKVISQEQSSNTESIQLQTDDPNSNIKIYVPDESNPEESDKLEIFKQLPPDFQAALKTGTLQALNESLAKVTGKEAEDILEICGKGGFLVVDEEIIVEKED